MLASFSCGFAPIYSRSSVVMRGRINGSQRAGLTSGALAGVATYQTTLQATSSKMDNNTRQHHTRSTADSQELISLANNERKQEPKNTLQSREQQSQQQDIFMDETESKRDVQANVDFMVVLQQMMAKQDLLLERNSQIE